MVQISELTTVLDRSGNAAPRLVKLIIWENFFRLAPGKLSVDQVLKDSQAATERAVK
jgi:hypothetical protein